jgi:hypothetical protein
MPQAYGPTRARYAPAALVVQHMAADQAVRVWSQVLPVSRSRIDAT